MIKYFAIVRKNCESVIKGYINCIMFYEHKSTLSKHGITHLCFYLVSSSEDVERRNCYDGCYWWWNIFLLSLSIFYRKGKFYIYVYIFHSNDYYFS